MQNSRYLQHTAIRHSHYKSSKQLEYIVTGRIHGHCALSTHLECIVNTPSVHSENTKQSLYPQYTAIIHSHYNTSTMLEYIVTALPEPPRFKGSLHPQYTSRIHNLYTLSTHLEYIISTPSVHSENTKQSLYPQYTTIIHSHYNTSTQLEYIITTRIYGHCTQST